MCNAGSEWLNPNDVGSFLSGLAILGTGGGGSVAFGRAIIENDFSRGRTYRVVPPDSVPDDALVVSGGIMGSTKVLDKFAPEEIVRRWEDKFEPLLALRVMEEFLGRQVDFLVPFELGGLNTPVILSLGARAGIPVVDGDGLGRAAPETQMTSFAGHGISIVPMPLVDWQGNVIIVREAADPFFPDEVGRFVISQAGGIGANIHYPMLGSVLRKAIVPHTLSLALKLGQQVNSLTNPEHIVQVLAEALHGRLAFCGNTRNITEIETLGFLTQTAVIEGVKEYRGSLLEVVIKNEFMMASEDGKPVCIFPDLVMMVNEGGKAVMSSELQEGELVWVIFAPCHPRLREAALSPEGRVVMNPERFAPQKLAYRPVEELSRRLGIKW